MKYRYQLILLGSIEDPIVEDIKMTPRLLMTRRSTSKATLYIVRSVLSAVK